MIIYYGLNAYFYELAKIYTTSPKMDNHFKKLQIEDAKSTEIDPHQPISVVVRDSYHNITHVSYNEADIKRDNTSRRDLFKATIDEKHADEALRGKNVYLKKVALTDKNQLQCWREIMIGMEIKHDLIGRIVDNWIEIEDEKPVHAYYATLDIGGMSIKKLMRSRGFLKRTGRSAEITFQQFAKIAQDLITTLIILKKNSVLHRDIIVQNVLVHDLFGKDLENPGPRTELIDFGWAKKIKGGTKTNNVGTVASKVAPELSLKTADYTSLITKQPYSYPVEIFATGQVLAEIVELEDGFFKVFKAQCGITETGNPLIDDSIAATMFTLLAEKSDEIDVPSDQRYSPMTTPSDEQLEAMKKVNPTCIMPDPEPYRNKLERFLKINGKRQKQVETDSPSQKFLRNFWFRYLDHSKGWNDHRVDLAVDLIMKMLNYWPEHRPTCEELYNHAIFKEVDGSGEPILPPRQDAESVEIMVKLSGDKNFQMFQGNLANQNSKLFMKTKRESEHVESSGSSMFGTNATGSKTTIHTIVHVQEKIEFKNNVRFKPAEVIDKYQCIVDSKNEAFLNTVSIDDLNDHFGNCALNKISTNNDNQIDGHSVNAKWGSSQQNLEIPSEDGDKYWDLY